MLFIWKEIFPTKKKCSFSLATFFCRSKKAYSAIEWQIETTPSAARKALWSDNVIRLLDRAASVSIFF